MHTENSRPAILCFAGLDPCGGAGLQADIETIASCGGHALPIATCLTVQNTLQALSVSAVDRKIIEQQFNALLEDIPIAACKISVIPNASVASSIAELIQQLPDIPIVYDPVISASHGSTFTDIDTINMIKTHLLPSVTVVTPNRSEITTLLGQSVTDIAHAAMLCSFGPKYVLATGADDNSEKVHNTLLSSNGVLERYSYHRLPHQYHGSGCTLSSALATFLAHNKYINTAAKFAQDFTYHSLQSAQSIGQGQWLPTRIKHSVI